MIRVRTPKDLGALIRERRRRLGLDQKRLAERVGVSRQWIIEVERGKPGAAIGLVLRTLDTLGVPLAVDEAANRPRSRRRGETTGHRRDRAQGTSLSMTTELVTLIGDRIAGVVQRKPSGRLAFVYDETWRHGRGVYPISLSMPLAASEHPHAAINAFLWGLLPDNELVLDRWAKQFQVSARSAFALLSHVGEDCAGAVRIVRRERVKALLGSGRGAVEWLTEAEVARRLRTLRRDAAAWRDPEDAGQFSLAGAQPKTALLFDGKRWGIPSGRIPTTHILKPGMQGLDGSAENEHFCLVLAAAIGLPVAKSRVVRFEDETAIVVERYDRERLRRALARIHQEDVCQALAKYPAPKYENEGGPGAKAIVGLLRDFSLNRDDDLQTFVTALAYNFLIAGTDAHAKNYSLLIGEAGRIRLAPLYDLASALPYHGPELYKLKLAMKIGGKYRIREIGPYQWRKLARELDLDPDVTVERVASIAAALPDLGASVRRRLRSQGLVHPVLGRLADRLAKRAGECAASFR